VRRQHHLRALLADHDACGIGLPETTVGMIEASATRKAWRPWTRSSRSTTAMGLVAVPSYRCRSGGRCRAAGAGVSEYVVVAHLVGPGLDLLGDAGLERLGRGEAARRAGRR
jgi:hypothetical protein